MDKAKMLDRLEDIVLELEKMLDECYKHGRGRDAEDINGAILNLEVVKWNLRKGHD